MPVVEPQGGQSFGGGESALPAFLQARPEPRPEAAAEGDEAPVKRAPRRRKPKSFEAGEGPSDEG